MTAPRKSVFRRLPYVFTWLTTAAIALLTLMPMPSEPDTGISIPHLDKAVHFIMFGTLATVWWWERLLATGCRAAAIRPLAGIAIATAAFGAADELLQGCISVGRSGDFADWIADVCGTLVMPMLCRKTITRLLPRDAVRLRRIRRLSTIASQMEQLYLEAFPPEERREWQQIINFATDHRHPLHFTLVTFGGEPCGFITWWQFDGFRYVEHFAIDSTKRGAGIGARAMKIFTQMHDDLVLLEAEPSSSGEMAERRINFYIRCGFQPHPQYDYIQPPYSSTLPPVPLTLMTAGNPVNESDLKHFDQTLKRMVYAAEPDFLIAHQQTLC